VKLLVTGGAGFIGSHLSEQLLEIGHSVIALDNLSTGSKENISKLLGNPNFELVQASMLDEELIRRTWKEIFPSLNL